MPLNHPSQSPSPKDDFYQYVNQKWLDDPANSIPDDYSSWGGFTKLHDDGLINQIKLVKNLTTSTDNTDKDNKNDSTLALESLKITAIWNASNSRFNQWQEGKYDYSAIIRELSNMTDYLTIHDAVGDDPDPFDKRYVTVLANYLHYSHVNGISNLLDFDKGSDLLVTDHVILDISAGGLSLPSRDYYFLEEFKEKCHLFKQHLHKVSGIIEDNCSLKLDPEFAERVFRFETEIATYTMKPDQSRKYDEYYTNTTLSQLYQQLNSLNSLEEKETNYPEAERNFQLIQSEISSAEVFFERLYQLFDFRTRLKNNRDRYFAEDINQQETELKTGGAASPSTPDVEHITAYDGDSLRRCLNLIFNPDNLRDYKCYLSYKIIKSFYSISSLELDLEFFNFYGKELDGQQKQKPEEKRSISLVNSLAGEMMGKLYVDKFFSQHDKHQLETLIHRVLDIMSDSVETNDWLTPGTKDLALEKLGKFSYKIGYPDKWKDYSEFQIKDGDSLYQIYKAAKKWSLQVNFYDKLNSKLDKTEWHMTPQTVNAYYSPNLNEIVFPAAILQPPFYHKDMETVVTDLDIRGERETVSDNLCLLAANLGGIGAVIAHEITHGFDDQGRKFDSSGNLNDWWSQEDVKLFKEKCDKVKGIAEKYRYNVEGLDLGDLTTNVQNDTNKQNQLDVDCVKVEVDKKNYQMNSDLTMGENLADMGGLSMSLKALNSYLSDETEEVTLATYRVFFKSWANIWKLNIHHDRKVMLLTCDPHAPCDFRGNLVKNYPEFYSAFGVEKGDGMYLSEDERLVMW